MYAENFLKPSYSSRKIFLPPYSDTLVLSKEGFLKGSVFLSSNQKQLVLNKDFFEDAQNGRIFLSQISTDTIRAEFSQYSIYLRKEPYIKFIQTSVKKDSSNDSILSFYNLKTNATSNKFNSQLNISGSKTISVLLGSNNTMNLDQTLNLNIAGKISKDISVSAILSDQNIPLQAEGTTESLREIDRMYISIKSPTFLGEMGDIFIENKYSKLLWFKKKSVGISTLLNKNNFSISSNISNSRGEFKSIIIQGEEQKQGPYNLYGRNLNSTVIILSGTENVFLDGKKLKRGLDNDYIIEYGQGSIEFMQKNLITSNSLIKVDYEYSELLYPKTIFTSGASIKPKISGLELNISFAGEYENKNDPLFFVIDSISKYKLSIAGDKSNTAGGSGIRKLLDDEFPSLFYILEDSFYSCHSNDEISEYSNQPRYSIIFSKTEEGLGSYILENSLNGLPIAYYLYVGMGLGNYNPGETITPAISRQGSEISYILDRPNINLFGDFAITDLDSNLFSKYDDENNISFSFKNILKTQSGDFLKNNGYGKFFLNISQEHFEKDFSAFTNSFDNYIMKNKWNLSTNEYLQQTFDMAEMDLKYSPTKANETGLGFGIFETDKISLSRFDFRYKYKNLKGLNILVEPSITIGEHQDSINILKHKYLSKSQISYNKYAIIPSFYFSNEYKDSSTSLNNIKEYFSNDFKFLAKYNESLPVALLFSYAYKIDKVNNFNSPTFEDSSSSKTFITKLNTNGMKFFNAELLTTYRNYKLYTADTNLTRTFDQNITQLFDLNIRSSILNSAIYQRFRYNIDASRRQVYNKIYSWEGLGAGNYKRDSLTGDYIPYIGGGYELIRHDIISTDSSKPISSLEAAYNLNLRPGKLFLFKNSSGFVKDLNIMTNIFIRHNKFPESNFSNYIPSFGVENLDSSSTSDFSLRILHSLSLNTPNKKSQFLLQYSKISSRVFSFYSDKHTIESLKLEFRHKPNNWFSFFISPLAKYINREKTSPSIFYNISIYESKLVLNVIPTSYILYSTEVKLQKALETNRDISFNSIYIEPLINFTIYKKFRFKLSYKWINQMSIDDDVFYEVAWGSNSGITNEFSVGGESNITKNLKFNINYTFRKENNNKPFQFGHGEMRAYF